MLLSRADEIKANVLVNNAGVSQFNRLENISEQAFKEAVDINLLAPIFLTKSFFQLGDTTGKIVINVGSALGSIGYPFYTSYCATKFGLKGFTEALQRELSQSKNQVLYFAPRATATSINSKAVDMMNKQLGNHVDQPQWVAQALVQQLSSLNKRKSLGWPEKLFARLNGLFPELVDRAIAKQMPILKNFI
jgi:short-subunit dehydrogenase